MSNFRRTIVQKLENRKIIFPVDYDRNVLPYYGFLKGYLYTGDDNFIVPFFFYIATSSDQWKLIHYQTWYRLSIVEAHKLKAWYSFDGSTWYLYSNGVISLDYIPTNLDKTKHPYVEGNCFINDWTNGTLEGASFNVDTYGARKAYSIGKFTLKKNAQYIIEFDMDVTLESFDKTMTSNNIVIVGNHGQTSIFQFGRKYFKAGTSTPYTQHITCSFESYVSLNNDIRIDFTNWVGTATISNISFTEILP